MTHLDTSFIVDLLREQARRAAGPAHARLERLADEALGLSIFVACELEAGAARARRPAGERDRVRAILHTLALILPDERFAAQYGELLARIQARGHTVATMDLLIATTAVVDDAVLVTRNGKHVEMIPGLTLATY